MSRCIFKFKSNSKSIILVIKLYSNKYPITIKNFLKLCNGNNSNLISFKKSKITRIISPEFIIQCGELKRSRGKLCDFQLVDCKEYEKATRGDNNTKYKSGLLCLVYNEDERIPIESKFEFFIILKDVSKYKDEVQLDKYMIIGELDKGTLSKLIEFCNSIKVNEMDEPIEECYIDRCGEVIRDTTTTTTTTTKEGEINAFEALYGKKK
ncbi:hypothetical protein CANARDRAFT_106630 [[Candida] arabinofermentans NRRL YB-2248]|uniref:PPIase cyclophilin-type domain-containing protein n=1 Tax=[Candida] arabinofermentans NRRL YB-2248 TaxID=983967 RepID=A0A1E4SU36_9ASCO|nr:hypothetical protein CANARDRAFT_106630 [[Candida] arabinofermentans NRRL YB-2248]